MLLECLLQLDADDAGLYDQFCDRLEQAMLPYIVSHSEEGALGANEEALPFV